MRFKRLGNTGLLVSEMCLGTMTFSDGEGFWKPFGKTEQRAADAIVRTAVEQGVNFFDTADVYSGGVSEIMLGTALRNLSIPREQAVIATKVFGKMGPGPNQGGLSRAHILSAVDASLRRLQVDHLDLYQIHGTDPLTPLEETMDALDACVRAGKVRYLGLSNLPAWQVMEALWICDRRGLAGFKSVQAYYSLVGRDVEREIIPMARAHGLGLLPWSPLASGSLTGKYSGVSAPPEGTRRTFSDYPPVDAERLERVLDAMRPIAQSHGVSLARVALAWLLHQPQVTSVIVGAKTEAQLLDNLAAAEIKLNDDELAKLGEVSQLPAEYPGWMLEFASSQRLHLIQ